MRHCSIRTMIGLLCVPLLAGCSMSSSQASKKVEWAATSPATVQELEEGELFTSPPSYVDVHTEPWEFAHHNGHEITTPHYRFYSTLKYKHVRQRLPIFMETALNEYASIITPLPLPKQRMDMYMFQDRRQWTTKMRQMLPDQYAAFENLGRGGFSTRGVAVLYYIDWYGRYHDTFAIAAHEGWHQYTQLTFRQDLPVWLEEGMATYMEGYRLDAEGNVSFQPSRNWERRRELREAFVRDRLIPMEELLNKTPADFLTEGKGRLLTYYAQVWALTRFLADADDGARRERLGRVLQDAATGALMGKLTTAPAVLARRGRQQAMVSRSGPWVILAYFESNLADFERAYLEYASSLVQASNTSGRRGRGRRGR